MASAAAAEPSQRVLGTKRRECWDARDAYFACVEAAGGSTSKGTAAQGGRAAAAGSSAGSSDVDAIALARCLRESEAFEARCPPSWVKHFKMQKSLGAVFTPGR
eukprot:TRINITY_DN74919_c0_g1_i1.p1 TRINITY_DN74919_c0_g1~~TRINITY_DN74919_c0_g1_i1.p1  ORF type:complete len:104 (-),score=25.45 TRINITY_DN74919_c0_g1_i1:29-340(-)